MSSLGSGVPPRWWIGFWGRRRKFLVVLVGLAMFAWLVFFLRWEAELREENRRQDLAEKAVQQIGGQVQRYSQWPYKRWSTTVVNLESAAIFDGRLSFVEEFPAGRLTGLSLGQNWVTDSGLKQIARATDLAILELGPRPDGVSPVAGRGARISDAGLSSLKPLRKLLTLGLQGTPITDAGLENLRGLGADHGGQIALSLAGTAITDAGLARLPELFPNLHWLELDGCAVTDEGCRSLARLNRLDHLSLNDTQVGDEGLRHLTELPNLSRLILDRTRVTDAGLKHIQAMKGPLRTISLSGAGVSTAKEVELRQNRSGLQVQ